MNSETVESNVFVEVCVASLEDAVAVEESGFHHIELNAALPLGGLTPSAGLVKQVCESTHLNVVAMCRPRPGGFFYSEAEWNTLLEDAHWLVSHGVGGIAVGVLDHERRIDTVRLSELRRRFPATRIVFHRAFDLACDTDVALKALIDCGVDRVLTSGGAASAWEGRDCLRELQTRAMGQIEILMGSGVSADNCRQLIQHTGCHAIHGSFSVPVMDPGYEQGPLRFAPNDGLRRCDRMALRRIRQILAMD